MSNIANCFHTRKKVSCLLSIVPFFLYVFIVSPEDGFFCGLKHVLSECSS
jgi:hypothetical protein